MIPRYDDPAETARQIASDIATWRRRLDDEEKARVSYKAATRGTRAPGRGWVHIRDDRREIDGMVRALSYVLGHPGETWLAEQFINDQDQEGTQ
jgi:hypothetical protein